MNCFSNWAVNPGLPWWLCIIPIVIMIGLMLMICRLGYKGAFFNCCHQTTPDLAGEIFGLRKELEDIKKKLELNKEEIS